MPCASFVALISPPMMGKYSILRSIFAILILFSLPFPLIAFPVNRDIPALISIRDILHQEWREMLVEPYMLIGNMIKSLKMSFDKSQHLGTQLFYLYILGKRLFC